MRKDLNGEMVYETLDELLQAKVVEIFEDSDNYYIRLEPEGFYDNCAWKADKKTQKVSIISWLEMQIDFLDGKIHRVELLDLKKRIA